MKIRELVRHKTALDWGIGVVVGWGSSNTKCRINFEGRRQAILDLSVAEKWLERVDPIEVAADSALLDPKRWSELELAPDQRSKKKDGAVQALQCEHCQKPLSRGVYSSDRRRKSCPRCSARDGNQHVFYPCPEGFGRSEERVTDNNPDGDQSYCYSCRDQEQPAKSTKCSTVTQ